MQKQFIPSGGYVLISPEQGPRISKSSFLFKALVYMLNEGAIKSTSGRCTSVLAEAIGESHRSSTGASTALNAGEEVGVLKREIRGRRTFNITVEQCVFPRGWWNKLSPCIITQLEEPEVEEPVKDEIITPTVVHTTSDMTLTDALIALSSAAMQVVQLMGGSDDELRAENQRLKSELNRLSTQLRGSTGPIGAMKVPTTSKVGDLNLHSLGVKDSRMRILLRHAWTNGFKVEKTRGDHIKLTPPDKTKDIVITSSTPSDNRVYENFYHQLIRAGMPAMSK